MSQSIKSSSRSTDPEVPEGNMLKLEDVVPQLEKPWYRYRHLVLLNFYLFSGILALVTSGYDGSMMNSLQSVPSWKKYFDHPAGSTLSTMSNGVVIGNLCAIPASFYLVDHLGRRGTIIVGSSIVVIGGILQGCAKNFGMFTGARILLGVGTCLAAAAAAPFLAELAYPPHRPVVTAMLLALYPLGSFTAALVTWGPYHSSMKNSNWSWRIPSLLQCFFPAVELVIAIFSPELPRWLIGHGKDERARQFFVKYHAGGDEDCPLVAFEMAEIKTVIEEEKMQLSGKISEWFGTRQRLRRLFIVCAVPMMAQLCGNALIAYYLTIVLDNLGITNANSQLKINLGITVYSLVWSVFISFNVDRYPRRWMFMGGYGLMCLTYVIWTILSAINQETDYKHKGLGKGVVAMIYLYSGFYHIASPVVSTYVMEICPYNLRGQGATIYQLMGNLILLFNNYVNNVAMNAITWRYYIVWCIWLAVQFNIVLFIFPETKGLGLEEVAAVFGEDITMAIKAGEEAIGLQDDKPTAVHLEHIELKNVSV